MGTVLEHLAHRRNLLQRLEDAALSGDGPSNLTAYWRNPNNLATFLQNLMDAAKLVETQPFELFLQIDLALMAPIIKRSNTNESGFLSLVNFLLVLDINVLKLSLH